MFQSKEAFDHAVKVVKTQNKEKYWQDGSFLF